MKNSDLRVLIIGPYPPYKDAGAYQFIEEQVMALSCKVNRVDVVSPIRLYPRFFSNLKFLPYTVRYHALSNNYSPVSNVGVNFVKVLKLPKLQRWPFIAVEKTIRYIERFNINFNIIHAHFLSFGVIAQKISEKFGVPFVITAHENTPLLEESLRFPSIKKAVQYADAVIRVNPYDLHFLENKRVFYIPNGIDLRKFPFIATKKARDLLGIPADQVVLVNVGSLREIKGQDFLLDVIHYILLKHDKNFHLYLIGEGPMKKKLEKKVRKLGINDHIHFVGRVNYSKIHIWLSAADLYLMASREESFGIAQLEALACGLKVLSTPTKGSMLFVNQGIDGYMVAECNTQQYGDAIVEMLERRVEAKQLRAWIEEKYSISLVIDKILDVYHTILS